MPLSSVQSAVLQFLASQRDPESYVAGATPLNRNTARFSADIDIFHSREDRLATAAENDAQKLEAAGYSIRWIRRSPAIYTAEVSSPAGATRLDWVVDSEFRFFPVSPDPIFGYVLHPIDLAANKVMAAAGRRELRDIVDLVTVHETILPLGALVWAAVEKSPGYSPEGLIAEIRRNSNYPAAEWRALATLEPIDPATVLTRLRTALEEAENFVSRMPTSKMGLLFLEAGKVVQPDPDQLSGYQTHAGQIRGHWPDSGARPTAIVEHSNGPESKND